MQHLRLLAPGEQLSQLHPTPATHLTPLGCRRGRAGPQEANRLWGKAVETATLATDLKACVDIERTTMPLFTYDVIEHMIHGWIIP